MPCFRTGHSAKERLIRRKSGRRSDSRDSSPPMPASIGMQEEAMMEIYHSFSTPLQKSIFLDALRAANETLFFRMLMDNVDELLPVVYTPTVGDFCKQYSHLLRFSRGDSR